MDAEQERDLSYRRRLDDGHDGDARQTKKLKLQTSTEIDFSENCDYQPEVTIKTEQMEYGESISISVCVGVKVPEPAPEPVLKAPEHVAEIIRPVKMEPEEHIESTSDDHAYNEDSIQEIKHESELLIELKSEPVQETKEYWDKFLVKTADEADEHANFDLSSISNRQECRFCPMNYRHLEFLNKHMRRNHLEKIDTDSSAYDDYRKPTKDQSTYTCKLCSHKFGNFYFFKKHVYRGHQKGVDFHYCSLCATVRNGKSLIVHHQFKCHQIPKPVLSFDTNYVNTWRDQHFPDRNECKYCPLYYGSASGLFVHIKQKHKIEKRTDATVFDAYLEVMKEPALHIKYEDGYEMDSEDSNDCSVCYKCVACADYFDDYHQFKLHVYQAHSGNKRFPMCKLCNRMFASSGSLNSHRNLVHSQFKEANVCHWCNKMFMIEQSYFTHMQSKHHLLPSSAFKNTRNYKRYLIKSKPRKKYEYRCVKPFMKQKKTFSSINEENYRDLYFIDRYDCKFCPLYFSGSAALLKHSKKYIDDSQHSVDIFKNYLVNTEIMKQENGESKDATITFGCNKCADTFVDYYQFKVHVFSAHRGLIKVYECQLCSIKLPTQCLLTAHRLTVHGETWDPDMTYCPETDGLMVDSTNQTLYTEPDATVDESTYRDMHFMDRYECKCCLNIYLTKPPLINHIKKTHSRQGFTTTSCETTYHQYRNFGKYLEEINGPDEAVAVQYRCKECTEKVYSDYHAFKRHVHYMHFTIKTNITCPDCGEMFSNNTIKQEHKTIQCQNVASFKESESKKEVEKPLSTPKIIIDSDEEDLPLAQYHADHKVEQQENDSEEEEEEVLLAKRERGRPGQEFSGRDLHFMDRYECKYCLYACVRSIGLTTHMNSEHSGINFRAKTIFEKYSQIVDGVTFNETTDTYSPTSMDGCNGCGANFCDYRTFKEHVIEKHKNTVPKSYVCETCYDEFEDGNSLKRHKLVDHAEITKYRDTCFPDRFECRFCPIFYQSDTNLMLHARKNHRNNTNTIFERYLLTTPNSIDDHFVDTEPPAPSISKCMECDSEFEDFHKFKLHVFKAHIDNRRYPECEVCFELFSNNSSLTGHMKRSHPGEHARSIGPKVPLILEAESPVESEMPDQEPEAADTAPVQKIEMEEPNEACSIDTDNTDAGSAYYQVNEVEQPTFECEYCQATFFSKFSYYKHRSSHTKKTENYCAPCAETFFIKYQYDVHMQEMHCGD